MVKKINFDGIDIKYDDAQLNKWSVQKDLTRFDKQFDALDRILCGKSDEVAEKLGDDMDKIMELLQRITATSGNAGKN